MKSRPHSIPAVLLSMLLEVSLLAVLVLPGMAADGPPVAGKGDKAGGEPPAAPTAGQPLPPPAKPIAAAAADDRPSRFERRAFRDTLEDQKAIWTSPAHFRLKDLKWFAPLGTITGLSFAYDPQISRRFVGHGTHVNTFQTVSTAGVVGMVGLGAGAYLLGVRDSNDRLRETGVLSAEAVADAMAYGTVLKYSFARERPGVGSGQGNFFSTENSPSFPSDHSLIAWSAASVIAHEYPGWATKLAVYGLASGVSVARVAGDKHYASDVLVASTAGWLIGRYVFKAHHERDLDVLDYGTFDSSPASSNPVHVPEEGMLPYAQGSTYVPLDSWIYPALRRLAALGFIPDQTAGMAPWTRAECLREVEEAESLLNEASKMAVEEDARSDEAQRLVSRLTQEFAEDSEGSFVPNYRSIAVESVYTRVGEIAGPPLRDGFDFGQTMVDDFGRPYGQGANVITGFSARGTSGRVAVYFRGEYQHAAAAPALPDAARTFIRDFDQVQLPPVVPFPATDRFRVNEAYLESYIWNLDFSVGKQVLWWGPSAEIGPWMYSNNAEPIYMLRFNNRNPWRLPLLGKVRIDAFFGKASGRLKPARPLLQGQKITFKPFRDLELGFSRTITFGGAGRQPLTLGSFWLSFKSVGDNPLADLPGHDPGDRRGGFDFTYHLPGLHRWGATLYGDGLTDDDPSPLAGGALPRTAWLGGLYIAQLPSLPKLDLRLEGASSDVVTTDPGRFIYTNTAGYKDGYVNNKNLIGSWVGRQGVGFNASSTYWISATSHLQFAYRRLKQDARFLPGGGTQNDASLSGEVRIRPEVELSAHVQYERWLLPILSPKPETNWATALQITIYPKKSLWHSRVATRNLP